MEFRLDNLEVERSNKSVYSEDGKTIKLFAENYPSSRDLNEAINLAKVAESTDLQIPKLVEVGKIGNRWALVMEYIEGNPLSKLIDDHPERLDAYLTFLAEVQLYISSKTVSMLPILKEKYRRKITESQEISEDAKFELLQRLNGMKNHTKLCHGDFSPSNVIIKPDGKYAIIDWAHATQGNASADIAKTYINFASNNRQEMGDKYLDIISEKSKINKEYIQRWLPIVAAAYLDSENENKELLKKWSDIVDFT